ncbi:MAG: Hsp20/alpha crystallin family protein [Myxococcota bacterium]
MANIIPSYGPAPTLQRDLDPFRLVRQVMRWDPFQEIAPATMGEPLYLNPPFDVYETDDAYVFSADLPGLREQDVDVTVTGNRITVSGRREQEKRKEGRSWYAAERSWGAFTRSFTLPAGCKLDEVQAHLDHGVLTLSVPKKAEVQTRKVAVGNGKKKVQ